MKLLPVLFLLGACGGSAPAPTSPPAVRSPDEPPRGPAGPVAPRAETRPHALPSPHGATRNDPYYWLRDDTRQDPAVLAYLAAENAYADQMLAPSATTATTLFTEMRSRIQEDDASVPTLDHGYWYYTRYETGKQHPIHVRRKGAMTAPEEVLLDANQLAANHAFYRIGAMAVSRDNTRLAWVDDTVGRNQFVLHVKDLATGALLPDTATNVATSLVWANDNQTLFFVSKDPTTLRADKLWRLALGAKEPTLVHEEKDGEFTVTVAATKSHAYLVVGLSSLDNSEIRLVDASKPTGPMRMVVPRERGHLYVLDHLDGRFLILTNDRAPNYRLAAASLATLSTRAKWKDVVPHDPAMLVESFAVYRDFIALSVRSGGLAKVRVLPAKGPAVMVDAPDPSYAMSVIDTPEPTAARVRVSYDAMTTPASVYEVDLVTKQRTLLKQRPVPGYDAAQYASAYLHATAADGAQIPISVVFKKTTKLDGTAPILVYGYGSYGFSMEPWFDSARTSLVDRGWVVAIAHIRGGQEMGRAWYDAGKLANKKTTFTDFISATEHLVAHGYGAAGHVFAEGRSAGGLLMGAVVNLRPDLYRGVIAGVPFVDVITTMTDVSIPLTTGEFVEWGNPIDDHAAYAYMLSYSPYDNVKAQAYPAMYVATGLWDSQVQYYEPAKWVAKLRATRTDTNTLVLVTDMTSGHGGAAGRFDKLRETARQYAFLLQMNSEPDRRR